MIIRAWRTVARRPRAQLPHSLSRFTRPLASWLGRVRSCTGRRRSGRTSALRVSGRDVRRCVLRPSRAAHRHEGRRVSPSDAITDSELRIVTKTPKGRRGLDQQGQVNELAELLRLHGDRALRAEPGLRNEITKLRRSYTQGFTPGSGD